MNPEEEIKRLNRLIRQFESVYRTTTDTFQKDRVAQELKKLKTYRDKLQSFHVIDPEALKESDKEDAFQNTPFLKELLAQELDREIEDREGLHLFLYLKNFEQEYLSLLSEKKLRLDFKHSLERDGVYHRLATLNRQLEEFLEDHERSHKYPGQQPEEEIRRRTFKMKHNLIVEADRFYRRLGEFTAGLIEDIDQQGMRCLNPSEVIHFEPIEGGQRLEGLTVREALSRLNEFCAEVVRYLNVPKIESQE